MCRIGVMWRCLSLVLLLAAPAAHAQDVGLVNLVAGEVSYAARGAAPEKAKPFMKVRDGDRFRLAAGAQLRVVYFDGGRQERWRGPASFQAARRQSAPLSGAPAEVLALPAGVPQRIARVPELLQNARLGGVQLRGGGRPGKADEAALREARATYDSLRKRLPEDDITPELYLYAVLSEQGLQGEMRSVAEEMQRRQPDNEEVKWLAKRVR